MLFQLMATTSNAAKAIGVHFIYLHTFSFPWSKYLGVELLDYMVDVCLTFFFETAKLFSKVIAVLIF